MHTSLLVGLLLLSGDDPSHAALHPKGASVFLEVQVERMRADLASLPLPQLLQEPAVRKAMAPWFNLDELRQGGLVEQAIRMADLPTDTVSSLATGLRGVRRISFSLTGLESDPKLAGRIEGLESRDPSQVLAVALGPVGLELVLDFASADLATRVSGLLDDAFGRIGGIRQEPGPLDFGSGGAAYSAYLLQGYGAEIEPAWMARSGSRLWIGWGVANAEAASARARDPVAGLASDPAYRRATTALGPGDTAFSRGFLRGPVLGRLESILAVTFPAAVDPLGLLERVIGSSSPSAWHMSAKSGRISTDSFQLAVPSGTPSWFGVRPVDLGAAKLVPSDAMAVVATTVDASALGQAVLGALSKHAAFDTETWMRELEQESGARPDRDLFANLGGNVIAWSMPLRGIALPQHAVYMDLVDPERFAQALQATGADLTERFPDVLRIVSREYRGHLLTTIELSEELARGPLASIRPCLTVFEGRLMLTLSDTLAKRQIKQTLAETAEGEASGQAVSSRELHPLFRGELGELDGALFAGSMDWGAMLAGIDALARTFGAFAGGSSGFDVSQLPPIDLLTRRLMPTVHITRKTEAGIRTRHEASFGPETWFGLPVFASAALHQYQERQRERADVLVVEEAVVDSARAETEASLRDIKLGLGTYLVVRGSYPRQLEELVAPTDSFPKGFLEALTMPSDGWGRAFVYERSTEGKAFILRSLGPDGVDQQGAGDDVSAP